MEILSGIIGIILMLGMTVCPIIAVILIHFQSKKIEQQNEKIQALIKMIEIKTKNDTKQKNLEKSENFMLLAIIQRVEQMTEKEQINLLAELKLKENNKSSKI